MNNELLKNYKIFEDLDDDIIGSQQKDYITKSVSIDWSKNNLRIKGHLKKLENLNPFISDDYTVKPNFKLNYEKGIGSFKFKVLADHAKYTFEENYNPLKVNSWAQIYNIFENTILEISSCT